MKKETFWKIMGLKLALKLVVLLCLTLAPISANAQRFESIAAVVNDDIITYGDIYDRMSVVIRSSSLPDNKDFRDKIKPQIVDSLILEQLQIQEAEKLGVTVADEEVEGGFEQVAQQNNMDVAKFKSILEQQGLPISSMARQIRSQIAWGKVVQQKLRPQVEINDQDIDAEIARLRAMAGKAEFLLAEILLPVQSEAEDAKAKDFAEKLVDQMKKGASFSSLARQFSVSAGAAQGGMIGWVSQDNLDPAIVDAVSSLGANEISAPIRTKQGYHIMLLRDKRVSTFVDPEDATLQIKELSLPISDVEGQNEESARVVAKNLTGCFDIEEKAESWAEAKIETYSLRVGELPNDAQVKFLNAVIGAPFEPTMRDENMMSVKMVCSKDMPAGNMPDREGIRQEIGMKRIEVLARSYLQDLQMQSYIEKRL